MEVKRIGAEWKVVNMTDLSETDAQLMTSEVSQPQFMTNENLIPCPNCGSRLVSGCSCARKKHQCSPRMRYQFDCIYCKELELDYSRPKGVSRSMEGKELTLEQGKKVKITFSNVEWKRYDNVQFHPSGARYNERPPHIVAEEERIEFHGYNVSQMDEGVYYEIGANDDFEIICDVDTSTIKPHPGGHLEIKLGIITARIDQNGGSFYLNGNTVAQVGSKFHMALSLTKGGTYTIEINGRLVGKTFSQNKKNIRIQFGFIHGPHDCHLLSHAYINNIQMSFTKGRQQ